MDFCLVRATLDRAIWVRVLGRGVISCSWGKTLNSQRASLHPDVQISTGEFNTGGNTAMDLSQVQGGIEIQLVPWEISTGLVGHLAQTQT